MRQRRAGVYGPYQHRRKWRIDVVAATGERHPELFDTAAEAHAVIREIKKAFGIADGMTVEESVDKYEKYLREVKENKPKSIEATRSRLERLLADCLDVQLRQLSADRCAQAYTKLVGELAVDSHRNILAEAKTWGRWCVMQGWIRRSPMEGVIAVGKRKRGKEQLRLDEARLFTDKALELAGSGEDGATAALCALLLGLRASEVVLRRVRDLDDGGRLIWIPFAKTKAGRRTLQIPDVLRPLLSKLATDKSPDDFLFSSHRREWILDWVKRLCIMAGVPVVSCHGLRGTHATVALDAGVSGQDVARSLGHTDERLTRTVYALPGAGGYVSRTALVEALRGGTLGGKKDGPDGGTSEPSGNAPN